MRTQKPDRINNTLHTERRSSTTHCKQIDLEWAISAFLFLRQILPARLKARLWLSPQQCTLGKEHRKSEKIVTIVTVTYVKSKSCIKRKHFQYCAFRLLVPFLSQGFNEETQLAKQVLLQDISGFQEILRAPKIRGFQGAARTFQKVSLAFQ